MSQSGVIFADSVFIVFLKSGNFPADGVQPIVFCIESSSTLEKRLRMFDRTNSHFGLRCGKLQTQIVRGGIGGVHVKLRGLILLAVELIGVSELGLSRRASSCGVN